MGRGGGGGVSWSEDRLYLGREGEVTWQERGLGGRGRGKRRGGEKEEGEERGGEGKQLHAKATTL